MFRCCEAVRSWSKINRSAEADAAARAISCNFPRPIRVAGSGLSRRCRNSPAISAPALMAKDRNSSNDSCGLNLRAVTCLAAAPLLCASRAAIAPSVRDAPLGMPARDERLLYSIPTKKARSAERLLLNRCVRRRFVGSSGLRKGGILNSEYQGCRTRQAEPKDHSFTKYSLRGCNAETLIA